MSTQAFDILSLVENAAQAWLRSNAPVADVVSASVLRGFEAALQDGSERPQIKLPCVVCISDRADYEFFPSGSSKVMLNLEVRSNADDLTSEAQHRARVDAVGALFVTLNIGGHLSASADGFTAQFVVPRSQSRRISDRKWITTIGLEIRCSPSAGLN